MRNWKQHSPEQAPDEFMDACILRSEIVPDDWVLGSHLRNWKQHQPEQAPDVYGRIILRTKIHLRCGGRVWADAELETAFARKHPDEFMDACTLWPEIHPLYGCRRVNAELN